MALPPISIVRGKAVSFVGDDVDTDRIIPARFMKCVTFDGLGEKLFHDVRFDESGASNEHPIDRPEHAGASILLAGNNFGCGSSREHAPQALYRFGFRAVVAEGFAEIFFGNSITLGMPCVSATRSDLAHLRDLVERDPILELEIDVSALQITAGSYTCPITLRPSARQALLEGRWDAIGELLEAIPEIERVADQQAYFKV
ncbi:MAG: 3-isopropylmalate dehydratase small subunit [Verrucomicrobiales bacterium]